MKVNPKKYFGQHFLKNPRTAKRIADSIPADPPEILEIGPGQGVLTGFLHEIFGNNLRLVEIDRKSIQYLTKEFPDITEDQIIQGDFMKLRADDLFRGEFQVAGNFPYNISSQILFRVIEFRDRIPVMTGMFQKEVARRIAASPGSKVYGILSVLTQAFYKAEILFSLSENEFIPPPKVKSAVVRLIRYNTYHLECDEKLFFRVVKTGFQQRRKTLRNSLKKLLPTPDTLPGKFSGERPEQLTVEDFVEITQAVQQNLSE